MNSYKITIGNQNELSLPDEYCDSLDINIGDVLKFTAAENGAILIEKNGDQSMTDEEIIASSNLARVFKADGSSRIT